MQPGYRGLEDVITMVETPNREGVRKLYTVNAQLFSQARGSTRKHQAWPGGYLDHVVDACNVGLVLYNGLAGCRPLPFSRSDVMLVMLLHDVEKPWKYIQEGGEWVRSEALRERKDAWALQLAKITEYGIVLDERQLNALKYVEGENDDYSSKGRVMNELAALCHCADIVSARLWYEYPKADDPWMGAGRVGTD